MFKDALRDLVLSGVQWELAENATVVSQTAVKQSSQNPVVNGAGRATPVVVPPIAPVQSISLDTVRSMAARPTDVDALKRMIQEFNHPLRSGTTNTVLPHVGTGKLLILTDIPSSDDDASGIVLSGSAGDLMDKMLQAIGLSRADVSILPMLFWRTPGGRTPTTEELELSRPFVNKAIELLSPQVVLTLGSLPASEYANVNLAKSHGVPVVLENGITVVPIFHPNYLILKPAAKRDVWNALQNMQNILKNA